MISDKAEISRLPALLAEAETLLDTCRAQIGLLEQSAAGEPCKGNPDDLPGVLRHTSASIIHIADRFEVRHAHDIYRTVPQYERSPSEDFRRIVFDPKLKANVAFLKAAHTWLSDLEKTVAAVRGKYLGGAT